LTISQAGSERIPQMRELLLEYWDRLGFTPCFQGFDQEVAELPGAYAPPDGRFLLAECTGLLAGCVALRKLEPGICEMKRLYLRRDFRGKGIGRALAQRIIAEARKIGYRAMRLDTVGPAMPEAVSLYRRLGFREIAAYHPFPVEGVMYMELAL
jgi:putative acetyltransferase